MYASIVFGIVAVLCGVSAKDCQSVEKTCINGKFYADPDNCGKYYHCANRRLLSRPCPNGTNFKPNGSRCEHTWAVDCNSPGRNWCKGVSKELFEPGTGKTPGGSDSSDTYPLVAVLIAIIVVLIVIIVVILIIRRRRRRRSDATHSSRCTAHNSNPHGAARPLPAVPGTSLGNADDIPILRDSSVYVEPNNMSRHRHGLYIDNPSYREASYMSIIPSRMPAVSNADGTTVDNPTNPPAAEYSYAYDHRPVTSPAIRDSSENTGTSPPQDAHAVVTQNNSSGLDITHAYDHLPLVSPAIRDSSENTGTSTPQDAHAVVTQNNSSGMDVTHTYMLYDHLALASPAIRDSSESTGTSPTHDAHAVVTQNNSSGLDITHTLDHLPLESPAIRDSSENTGTSTPQDAHAVVTQNSDERILGDIL